jgi:16S rRNA G1207 methylase RsmC
MTNNHAKVAHCKRATSSQRVLLRLKDASFWPSNIVKLSNVYKIKSSQSYKNIFSNPPSHQSSYTAFSWEYNK